MALDTQMSTEAVNAEANALAALFDNGYLRLYDGSKPASANTAVTTQTLLAELRFGATAFGAAVDGVLTANPITADASANATGTATWFRCVKSDGASAILDGTIGTSASFNLQMPTTSIVAAQTVSCDGFTHTLPKATAGL